MIYVKQPIHMYPVFPYILLYFRLMLYKEDTCCNKHFIYYSILNESEHQFLELWEMVLLNIYVASCPSFVES